MEIGKTFYFEKDSNFFQTIFKDDLNAGYINYAVRGSCL